MRISALRSELEASLLFLVSQNDPKPGPLSRVKILPVGMKHGRGALATGVYVDGLSGRDGVAARVDRVPQVAVQRLSPAALPHLVIRPRQLPQQLRLAHVVGVVPEEEEQVGTQRGLAQEALDLSLQTLWRDRL